MRWSEVLTRYDAFTDRNVGPHRWVGRDRFVELLDAAADGGRDPQAAADAVIVAVFAEYARRYRLGADSMLVEKTPNHLYYADHIRRCFPDAVFVELRRDGRDVCVSLERRARRVDWPPSDRADQIRLWSSAIAEGVRLASSSAHAGRWHVVRFEDLVADCATEVRDLFGFLDLPTSGDLVSTIVAESHISRVSTAGDGEHVRKGEVGDWRNHFSAGDATLFRDLAGDVSAAAGYSA